MLVSTACTNSPWNSGNFIYVLQFYYSQARNGILQIAFGYDTSKFGFRSYSSGSWTAWKILT
jgi:hypothetical protein